MNHRQFTIQLVIISLCTAVLLLIFHTLVDVSSFPNFSWLCLGFFIIFSWLMYFFGWQTSTSSDRNAFTRIVIGFMGLKMGLCIVLVVAYAKLFEPGSKLFLIPFFLVYLIFTVFETWFMSKLGKVKPA